MAITPWPSHSNHHAVAIIKLSIHSVHHTITLTVTVHNDYLTSGNQTVSISQWPSHGVHNTVDITVATKQLLSPSIHHTMNITKEPSQSGYLRVTIIQSPSYSHHWGWPWHGSHHKMDKTKWLWHNDHKMAHNKMITQWASVSTPNGNHMMTITE